MNLYLSHFNCLGESLRDSMITYKTNTALIEADRYTETGRWEYWELETEAKRIAIRFQQLGMGAGDRCAILMSNQSKWIISAVAAIFRGCVLVPLDYKLTADEQAYLIGHAKPSIVITEYPIYRSLLGSLKEDFPADIHIIVTEAPEDADLKVATRWEEPAEGSFEFVPRQRQDLASIVYSSGTFGKPKGCMLTHDNYLEQAQSLGQLFPMEETDRFFSILPTNHAIDFMCGFIIPLLFGAAVVHQRTLRPKYLASTMKNYQITQIALVQRILCSLGQRLREEIEKLSPNKRLLLDTLITINELATRREPNPKLSRLLLKPIHDRLGGHLKLIVAGGTFIDPKCAEFFYSLGIPIAIGYGLTESCVVLTVNDLNPFRSDTVGKPIPGVEIKLNNKNDEGIGEVYAKGRTIIKGYLDDPELSKRTLQDGWLHTGDLGLIDAAGHLKLVGRIKNMIVTPGGKNVYPEDVEVAFENLPDCKELCAFAANFIWKNRGFEDEQIVLILHLETDESNKNLLTDLRKRNRRLADYKRASHYLIWNRQFPRTATEKIKRNQLADEIATSLQPDSALQTI